MEFKRLFASMILVTLLVYSLMAFVITTQTQNNQQYLITNNSLINSSYGSLADELNDANNNAGDAEDSFGKVTPSQTLGVLDVLSIVSPTRLYQKTVKGTYNILIALPMQILGISPIVASVISSILIIMMLIGIWAIWKGVVN